MSVLLSHVFTPFLRAFTLDVQFQLFDSPGSLLLYFVLHNAPHIFNGDRSELQAGQSSTCTLLLRSHIVVTRAECGLALSGWDVPEEDVAWRAACVAPKP